MTWMQTFSGRAFRLDAPLTSGVHWPDVIYGLAHINRFCGHAGTYSVAQHSVLVAEQLRPEWKLYGLLHDAAEAYTGDITTPVKRWLVDEGQWQLEAMTERVECAVYAAADLTYPVPETIAEAVHVADVRALMTERRDLMAPAPKSWGMEYDAVTPLPDRIVRWSPQQAIARFTSALIDAGLPVAAASFAS